MSSSGQGTNGTDGEDGTNGTDGADGLEGSEGPAGPQGRRGRTGLTGAGVPGAMGPAGPPGPRGVDSPDVEPVPQGYQLASRYLQAHPKLRSLSTVTIVFWMVLLIGGGLLYLSQAHSSDELNRVEKADQQRLALIHNASACSLKTFFEVALKTNTLSAADSAIAPSIRARSRVTIRELRPLIAGQITEPSDLDCKAFLSDLTTTKLGVPANARK